MSNIETITREHDNFSSSYDELVNLLEKVITNREMISMTWKKHMLPIQKITMKLKEY